MPPPKFKMLALAAILALFVFSGCSSNPASSTLTCGDDGRIDCPYADNTAGATCDSSGEPCGHPTTPTSGPPEKYDEDNNNDTTNMPVYPH